MAEQVLSWDTPDDAREIADRFLTGEPVLNNLVLTILADRIAHAQPGRYWVVRSGRAITGVALQSPLDFPLQLSAMAPRVAVALADAVALQAPGLPGVSGEARVAARFAGQWMERLGVGAHPTRGLRLHEARVIEPGAVVAPGALEQAGQRDAPRLREGMVAFRAELGKPADDLAFLDRRVEAGEVWLWRDGGPTAMAAHTDPIAGVARVNFVYTPPEHRRRGYAEALVRSLTGHLLGRGLRPVLFTDLGDPSANAVYRRVGYEAAAEFVRFRFDPAEAPDAHRSVRAETPPRARE